MHSQFYSSLKLPITLQSKPALEIRAMLFNDNHYYSAAAAAVSYSYRHVLLRTI